MASIIWTALIPKCVRVGVGIRVVTGHRYGEELSVDGDGEEIQLVASGSYKELKYPRAHWQTTWSESSFGLLK
jgi:hypothetical protein